MMKAPTNSDDEANTSRNVVQEPEPLVLWSRRLLRGVGARDGLVAVRQHLGDGRRSSPCRHAVVGRRPIRKSNVPERSSTSWAVGVEDATVAPPRLSVSPNPTMPTIVNSCGAAPGQTVIRSPTARSAVSACRVDATSSSRAAPVRDERVAERRVRRSRHADVGAPAGCDRLAVRVDDLRVALDVALGRATPATASRPSHDSGTGSGPAARRPGRPWRTRPTRTWTSMPPSSSAKRSSNAALNVSVST